MTGTRTFCFTSVALATGLQVAILATPDRADACGCLAPPDVATPVVQAGERIVFAHENGRVTAHIQIQYQGAAEEFGWILPMPAVPTVRVGSEELFAALEANTAPTFITTTTGGFCGGGGGFGCSSDAALSRAAPEVDDPNKVVVIQSTAGPYDYAVLDAKDKSAMLTWLNDNGYFIPTGTEDVMAPYVHDGAYFLAIKLRSGQSVGDLQPVVIEYDSDLPMIPIVLTSVAATPDMGILVYILGDARAIPRNYEHVLINEEHIAWFDDAKNYAEVVSRAIDETESHHAFVTEFAGSTDRMQGLLFRFDRFGNRQTYENEDRAIDFLSYLFRHNFPEGSLDGILRRHFPMPQEAIDDGITETAYYNDLINALRQYAPNAPFDAALLTDEIWERIVQPTIEANQLFDDNPWLTRMFTVLSPEEMTADPVFSFNPDLPSVDNEHNATLETLCDEDDRPLQFTLPNGRVYRLDTTQEWQERDRAEVPRASRIEILREEGAPEVTIDNRGVLDDYYNESEVGGCTSMGRSTTSGLINLMVMLLIVGGARRALRRR